MVNQFVKVTQLWQSVQRHVRSIGKALGRAKRRVLTFAKTHRFALAQLVASLAASVGLGSLFRWEVGVIVFSLLILYYSILAEAAATKPPKPKAE